MTYIRTTFLAITTAVLAFLLLVLSVPVSHSQAQTTEENDVDIETEVITEEEFVAPDLVYGCADPEAENWNPEATEDDGACEYGGAGFDDDEESSGNEFTPVLLTDDFNDGNLNLEKWILGDGIVVEEEGVLKLRTEDNIPGRIYSQWFAFDPDEPLEISRRTLQHAANDKYIGALTLQIDVTNDDVADKVVQVNHSHYTRSYGSGPNSVTRHGTYLNEDGSSENISELLPVILGSWFEESLTYHATEQQLSYVRNDTETLSFETGALPESNGAYRVRVTMVPWGWESGHYNYTDDFVFRGTAVEAMDEIADCTDPTATNYNPKAEIDDGTCEYDQYSCGDPIEDSDGNTYGTVQVGTQCWMAENLNVGTMITGGDHQTDNDVVEKYCYDNDTANCEVDGGLYQWNEAMQYGTTEGVQGICPAGWHIPTDDEWLTLEQYFSNSGSTCDKDNRDANGWGCYGAGTALKEGGVSGLDFNPSGQYSYEFMSFLHGREQVALEQGAYMWTSSFATPTNAWLRHLNFATYLTGTSRFNHSKTLGQSIRCIQGEGAVEPEPEVFTCGTSDVQDIDGNTYGTVEIGNQCWMTENLQVGTMVQGSDEQTDDSVIEKYCYDNDMANCETDGGLYQWNEAMQYSATEGAQGICPDGWHIPSDSEFHELDSYLTDSGQACDPSRDGTNGAYGWDCFTAGTKLKTGSDGLEFPLAGSRLLDGSFNWGNVSSYLLSSTQGPDVADGPYAGWETAWGRFLTNFSGPNLYSPSGWSDWDRSGVSRFTDVVEYGSSVRCVKDSETEPEPVLGCTNPEAINYDPEATQDDGSCTMDTDEGAVYLHAELDAENRIVVPIPLPENLYYNSYSIGYTPLGWSDTTEFTALFGGVFGNKTEYDSARDLDDIVNEKMAVSGGPKTGYYYIHLIDIKTGDYNGCYPDDHVEGGKCGPNGLGSRAYLQFYYDEATDTFTSQPSGHVNVAGCTDPKATNYDPDATEDDGSCLILPVSVSLTTSPELGYGDDGEEYQTVSPNRAIASYENFTFKVVYSGPESGLEPAVYTEIYSPNDFSVNSSVYEMMEDKKAWDSLKWVSGSHYSLSGVERMAGHVNGRDGFNKDDSISFILTGVGKKKVVLKTAATYWNQTPLPGPDGVRVNLTAYDNSGEVVEKVTKLLTPSADNPLLHDLAIESAEGNIFKVEFKVDSSDKAEAWILGMETWEDFRLLTDIDAEEASLRDGLYENGEQFSATLPFAEGVHYSAMRIGKTGDQQLLGTFEAASMHEDVDSNLTFDPACPGNTSKPNLVLITHGWKDFGGSDWITAMRDTIEDQVDKDKWEVCYYDWGADSVTHWTGDEQDFNLWFKTNANDAWSNAGAHGTELGKEIAKNHQFNSIHFIAHSAGSNLIESASREIDQRLGDKAPIMHLTFLDAYAPKGSESYYGTYATWAEQYFNHESIVLDTNHLLPHAYNFEVTFAQWPVDNLASGHSFPYKWYQDSVDAFAGLSALYDETEDFGFTFSKESGEYSLPLRYFPSGSCKLGDPFRIGDCETRLSLTELQDVLDGPLQPFILQGANQTVKPGPVGTTEVTNDETGADLEQGSPAWFDFEVEVSEGQDVLSFYYEWLSPQGAEGLLTVYLDGFPIVKVDETKSGEGRHLIQDLPIGAVSPGTHTLRFYLDSPSTIKSKINISALRFGETVFAQIENDLLAPVTQFLIVGCDEFDRCIDKALIVLRAEDNDGGSGVQNTEYSYDGEDWNEYTEPLEFSEEGEHTIYYRSTDWFGNVEEAKSVSFEIVSAQGLREKAAETLNGLEIENNQVQRDIAQIINTLERTLEDQYWSDRNTYVYPGRAVPGLDRGLLRQLEQMIAGQGAYARNPISEVLQQDLINVKADIELSAAIVVVGEQSVVRSRSGGGGGSRSLSRSAPVGQVAGIQTTDTERLILLQELLRVLTVYRDLLLQSTER